MFRAVRADTGAIGGSRSHEFQVIADTGEDLIAYAPESDYAANIELAEAFSVLSGREEAKETMEKRATPGKEKCELVAEYLASIFFAASRALCSPPTARTKRAIRCPRRSCSSSCAPIMS